MALTPEQRCPWCRPSRHVMASTKPRRTHAAVPLCSSSMVSGDACCEMPVLCDASPAPPASRCESIHGMVGWQRTSGIDKAMRSPRHRSGKHQAQYSSKMASMPSADSDFDLIHDQKAQTQTSAGDPVDCPWSSPVTSLLMPPAVHHSHRGFPQSQKAHRRWPPRRSPPRSVPPAPSGRLPRRCAAVRPRQDFLPGGAA